MKEKIEQLRREIESFPFYSPDAAEQFRIRYLGRKGIIPSLFDDFRNVPPDRKKETGKILNELKNLAQDLLDFNSGRKELHGESSNVDLTRPAYPQPLGSRHPISIVRNEITAIFARLRFTVSEGPEIEDDNHYISRLNFAPDHPARDMQDTFFISRKSQENSSIDDILLRTHTSSVQVRVMESQRPPIRTISPGRVFRNEAVSARAHCIFHQVEGLYIDTDVSFADLRQVLTYFCREMFGTSVEIRLRPSYFPFTEPSAELDVSCLLCGGKGCNVCKYTGWLEVLGCGMVHPAVLEACGIDSEKYTGYAFGMGIERIAMLRYRVDDLRLYFENDIRFLSQFRSSI
jgi:phenylalanyl-tRNA synthetase alpha chain